MRWVGNIRIPLDNRLSDRNLGVLVCLITTYVELLKVRSKLRKFWCLLPTVSAASTLVLFRLSCLSNRLAENDLLRIKPRLATVSTCPSTLPPKLS